jgi:hypothetical protein
MASPLRARAPAGSLLNYYSAAFFARREDSEE